MSDDLASWVADDPLWPTMTREEWLDWVRAKEPDFDEWCERAKREVVACNCDYPGCRGWVVQRRR